VSLRNQILLGRPIYQTSSRTIRPTVRFGFPLPTCSSRWGAFLGTEFSTAPDYR
jgi:hypothetical protein